VPLSPPLPAAARTAPRPDHARPSRLPRDPDPPGHDGKPATRWTDPRTAAAYAERDDTLERAAVWPVLTEAVRPARPSRTPGRPDGAVLDLGCGIGAYAHHLATTHWLRVHAADPSPALHRLGAATLRDAWLKRCLPDPRGRLTLRPAQCTAAVAHLVLTHLPHTAHIIGTLAEARRVLRPGAPLAVVEPGAHGPTRPDASAQWGASDSEADEGQPFPARYLLRDGGTLTTTAWRHSPHTLAACLRAAGFDVEKLQYLGGVAPGAPAPYLLLLCRAV
jgi:SAM-dependent methyltransferase